MKQAYCLLNHQLTEKQITELQGKFGCNKIVYPSEGLSKMWSQIGTEPELDKNVINTAIQWLSGAQKDDVLVVQGEFGSTFIIADYALHNELNPLYAVTKRVEEEQVHGERVHRQYVFTHVCFRKYQKYI